MVRSFVSEVPLYEITLVGKAAAEGPCEDWILDGPASGGKGSKGRNYLDCYSG